MAFDPHQEDYQRLMLRFARTLRGGQSANVRAFATFAGRFARERDALPQTDADRAFHLVVDAATLIDHELPFATDEVAETIASQAHRLLDEALALDARCHDARRMLYAAETTSFEDYYAFLREGRDEVRAQCEEARAAALGEGPVERTGLAGRLAMYPYLRWLATLASKALVCGRNRAVLGYARELLEIDPSDPADVRRTAALALGKLEDEAGLEQLTREVGTSVRRPAGNAWMALARLAVAHSRRDFATARELLRDLLDGYPRAVPTLARQYELPDGVFARLACEPYSEDELVLAVSEGAVLLQEGRDELGLGVLGAWVLRETLSQANGLQLIELRDLVEMIGGLEALGRQAPAAGSGGTGREPSVPDGEMGEADGPADGARRLPRGPAPGGGEDEATHGEADNMGGDAR